jgi:hypothetical protein
MKNHRAYPTQNFEYDGQGNVLHWQHEGMTLLDHFAGLAMQACLARGDDTNRPGIAEWSYTMAEAMLKERVKYERED